MAVRKGPVSSSNIFMTMQSPRPVLAAAGETSHFIDTDTGLIVRYEERWKSDPWEVVKRLFVPGK